MKRTALIVVALCASALAACNQQPYPLAPQSVGGTMKPFYQADERRTRWYSVWGSDPDHVFVGGAGVVYAFDGTSWQKQTLPGGGSIHDIWGTSADTVFAVNPDLFRYNGSEWESVGCCGRSVYGFAPDDVFMGTYSLYHYDGDTLTTVLPFPFFPRVDDLWGTSPRNLYLVEPGRVQRWDGDTLTTVFETQAYLYDIWGSSADDIYVGAENGILYHYDGTAWNTEDLGTIYDVYSVWGTGPDDVYALTYYAIFRFDGTQWGRIPPPTVGGYMTDGWGSVNTEMVVAGGESVVRYQDGKWYPGLGQEPTRINVVWPLSRDEVVATWVDRGGSRIHHGVSGEWSELPMSPDPLQAMWGDDVSDMYAVSPFGLGWHFDGTRWTSTGNTPSQSFLLDVWSPGGSPAVACGGGIEVFDGTRWSSLPNPAKNALIGVSGSDMDNVAFASENNEVVRCVDGDTSVVAFAGVITRDVWVADRSFTVAVGTTDDNSRTGVVLQFDGHAWERASWAPDWDRPEIVVGASNSEAYIVGVHGQLYEYDGHYWFPIEATVEPGSRVRMSPDGTLFSSNARGIYYLAK